MEQTQQKLPIEFYTRNVHVIAKDLLGKIFVRKFNSIYLTGKIVEVEAYDGKIDEASHSFNGMTKRNEVMFNGGGKLYVYFTYGMHFCANVVTGPPGDRTAVLIRAIDPLDNIEQLAVNRFAKKDISKKEFTNLSNGPGKICKAFAIGRSDNGTSLTGSNIFILDAPAISKRQIITSTRIGIKKSVDLPWRYSIKDNPFVSVNPLKRNNK